MSKMQITFLDDSVYLTFEIPDIFCKRFLNCIDDECYQYLVSFDGDHDDEAGYFMANFHQFKNMAKASGCFDFVEANYINDIKTDIALDQ